MKLPCPMCGEPASTIHWNLDDRVLTCKDCENEFTPEHLELLIEKWKNIIPWLKSMPKE